MMQPQSDQIALSDSIDEADSSLIPQQEKNCFGRCTYCEDDPWRNEPWGNNLSSYVFGARYGFIPPCKFRKVSNSLHCKDMASFQKRLKSFQDRWPKQLAQTGMELASAGFYYEGIGDRVNTFCCGITLRQWNHFDEPWQEHKKHSPNCQLYQVVNK